MFCILELKLKKKQKFKTVSLKSGQIVRNFIFKKKEKEDEFQTIFQTNKTII